MISLERQRPDGVSSSLVQRASMTWHTPYTPVPGEDTVVLYNPANVSGIRKQPLRIQPKFQAIHGAIL